MSDDAKKPNRYVLGKHSIVGDARQSWEDRVFVGRVERKQVPPLIVGMVADGVGSADAGSRAADLAIKTALQFIESSAPGKSIPDVIEEACIAANRAVYSDNQQYEDRQGQTTLVVCVIQNNRLYVGNIGDSRAYWVTPQGKLLQLTRDHTFYNIHGGSSTAPNAQAVVNAIGLKRDIEVDLGIYLQPGISKEKAYEIGYAGIALQPGDSVILCSDGLIKTDSAGQRFASDEEIVQSLQTEYNPDKAAIKMVSIAEGRRPNDNVSAVTIQCVSDELLAQRHVLQPARRAPSRFPVFFAAIALVGVLLVGAGLFAFFWMNRLVASEPTLAPPTYTSSPTLTSTPMPPTATPTEVINPGQARVEEIRGVGANVRLGQYLSPGAPIISSTDGMKIVLGTQQGRASLVYWLGGSAGILNFDASRASPVLEKGALCLNPQDGKSEIRFNKPGLEDVNVAVENGRMIVELLEEGFQVYCFSGECRIDPGGNADWFKIAVENKRTYSLLDKNAKPNETMEYAEKLLWYQRSLDCLNGLVSTPTPTQPLVFRTPTPVRRSDDVTPVPSQNTPISAATLTPLPPTTQAPPTTEVPPTTPVPPTTELPPPIPTTQPPPPYPSE